MIRERVFELTIASLMWLTYSVNIKSSVLSVEKVYMAKKPLISVAKNNQFRLLQLGHAQNILKTDRAIWL